MSERIAVIGSNMVDLITYVDRMPELGETLEAPRFVMGYGGKGANQAVAAARLGGDVMLVSRIGDDSFADNTLTNLQRQGIDIRHVEKVADTTSGVAPIFVEPGGENSILIVKGANAHLLPAEIDRAADDLADCGLILLQLEIPLETVYHAVAFGARHGIPTVLNPAPAASALDLDQLSTLDFLVPNQTELAMLSGLPIDSRDDVIPAAQALIARGIRAVIVTLGAEGVMFVDPERSVHLPTVSVDVHDTTGAGDAFVGSFARYYVRDRNIDTALHNAVRYAADSVTRLGTQSSYADLAAFEQTLSGIA